MTIADHNQQGRPAACADYDLRTFLCDGVGPRSRDRRSFRVQAAATSCCALTCGKLLRLNEPPVALALVSHWGNLPSFYLNPGCPLLDPRVASAVALLVPGRRYSRRACVRHGGGVEHRPERAAGNRGPTQELAALDPSRRVELARSAHVAREPAG